MFPLKTNRLTHPSGFSFVPRGTHWRAQRRTPMDKYEKTVRNLEAELWVISNWLREIADTLRDAREDEFGPHFDPSALKKGDEA